MTIGLPFESWNPPPDWIRIRTLDAHTGGEPLRIVVAGFPTPEGGTMLEKRRFAQERHDALRRALMWEPRGHREMYGCILTPPVTRDAHFGVLFTHNDGFSTMCGHGIIAVATAAVQVGFVPRSGPETVVRIDTPAGRVTAFVASKGETVESVSFENVPSYVVALGESVEVEGSGVIPCDLAFGGAYYAYVDADTLDVSLIPHNAHRLVQLGRMIKRALTDKIRIRHPFDDEMSFLYGTIFTGVSDKDGIHSKNICVFADGEVDRSPTGTGLSGRLAILREKGELKLQETIAVESIVGSVFRGTIVRSEKFGNHDAVIPRIQGSAFLTGKHEFFLDPADPFKEGFFLS